MQMKNWLRWHRFFAITACVWSAAVMAQPITPQRGGTLVQLTYPEPPSLAPYINTSLAVPQVSSKIYEGLLEYDFAAQPQPGLAASWQVADDGKSITFQLQKGVKFHDGQPFTSEDVRFTFMEVLKKVHPRGLVFLAALADVETPDLHTAIFRLTNPAPYLLMALSAADSPVIPKHVFGQGDIRSHPNANKPIGTGPFKLTEWRRGEFIRLDRNPDYWQAGLPYLDRVVVRFVPDASTRTVLLEKGEAHLAGFSTVPYSDARRLAGVASLDVSTRGYQMFSLVEALAFNTTRAPFDNQKVRQALSYAVDRPFIAEHIYYGFATPATGQIHANLAASGLYNPNVRDYNAPDRIDIANRLLDEAGLPRQANGVRFEVTLDTTASYGEFYLRYAEIVQQNFAQVGVKLNLRSEDLPTFLHRVFTDYDFDITQVGLANLADPVLGAHRALHSSGIRKGSVFVNNTHWSSAETDALMDAATVETDPEKRQALYAELQRLAAEAAPVIWTVNVNYPTVVNKKVHNAISTAHGVHGSLADAWLEK